MKPLTIYASALPLALAALGTAAQATDLVYGSYLSPEHGNNKYGVVRFIEEAERASEGSLKFQYIPGGALAGAKTTLSSIRDGIVDSGIVVSLYHASDLPYNSIITNMTAFGGDAAVLAGATNETTLLNCPKCMEEWESWNIKHLGAYSTSGYKFLCREEVRSLGDGHLRGASTWADRMHGRIAELAQDLLARRCCEIRLRHAERCLFRGHPGQYQSRQVECSFGSGKTGPHFRGAKSRFRRNCHGLRG
jgi:hypothetical protein